MLGEKLGSYQILEEIGKGGMATVYRAYQHTVERDVAIKVITKTTLGSTNAIDRFQREARLIARLEHPHILPVYDFDGRHTPPYIVMRYLNGGTLKEIIKQGVLPLNEISYLIHQVGSALDYAHRQGIIHRDIKPSNILIDKDGNAFVTDFGIARMTESYATDKQLTETGAIVGTPNYMSPEQAMGTDNVTVQADIYSLGVILFQMLTGKLPFVSNTKIGTLIMHMQEPIPSVIAYNSALPAKIDEVIACVLAKETEKRYQSVSEFVETVIETLGEKVSTHPEHLRKTAIKLATIHQNKSSNKTITKTSSQTGTPNAQNKTVTVLYANAAEYAEILDEFSGSEIAHQAINSLWDSAKKTINKHNGLVFSQTEDTLMALWGVDTARENDPEHAIQAALEMQNILQQQKAFNAIKTEVFNPDEIDDDFIPLNIGINTGLALLTHSNQDKGYTASGATISLANRLMQNANGSILITHNTYTHVRGVFEVEVDTPLKIRRTGKHSSTKRTYQNLLPIYCITDIKERAFRMSSRGIEDVETQLIGRESELKTLQNAFLDSFEEEETQIVTIISKAGLGKSRLLYEFMNWVDLRPELIRLFRGRATPEMINAPYGLIRNMLTFRFQIRDNDNPKTVVKKLESGVSELIESNNEIAHFIGHLAGFDLSNSPFIKGLLTDPQQLTLRSQQLFITWIIKLCNARPVIIELEDIHYADNASLDLLTTLTTEHDDLPLFIVYSARPSLLERRSAWSSGQNFHTLLKLNPLNRRNSRQLVREILQKVEDVPKALRDLLVNRAEGNPYYMEELVKMLIDDRVIIKDTDEIWHVETARITQLNVPSTLVGLLEARLDSLLYPEKLTLQRAAVIGRIFYDSALKALDAADETHLDDLPNILNKLTQHQFIQIRETTHLQGNTEYVFSGEMLRDVLLNTLLSHQHYIYNKTAAEWLIKNSGERVDEYAKIIAEYYEKAGEKDKAAKYLEQTGEKALQISAIKEAHNLFQQALNLLPKSANNVTSVNFKLGQTYNLLGDFKSAKKLFKLAHETAKDKNDEQAIAQALYWLSQIAVTEGNYRQAQTYLESSVALARCGDDESILAQVLYGLGDLNWRLGKFDKAQSHCQESLILATKIKDITQQLYIFNRLGVIFASQGNLEKAEQMHEKTLRLAQQVGNRERTATALNNLGEIARERGDTATAQVYYHQALPIAQEISDPLFTVLLLNNLAFGFIKLENLKAAQEHIYKGIKLGTKIRAFPYVLALVVSTGQLFITQGHQKKGLALLGLGLYHQISYSELKKEVYNILNYLQLDINNLEVADRLEQGKHLDFETTIKKILAELTELC